MIMTHSLVCMWSDGKETISLHSCKDYAQRKLSTLLRKPQSNRIKGEVPKFSINEIENKA